MSARIRMRRRVTSGNIKDPELHQEHIADIHLRRQAVWTFVLVMVGGLVFVTVSVAMRFING